MRNDLITAELEGEENFKDRKDFYGSAAHLAMMPFHHLLCVRDIHPAISRRQPVDSALVSPDDSISVEFTDVDDDGMPVATSWEVFFLRNALQGSAEIYRAEMFLFKRPVYEREERLEETFIITDKKFPDYLDDEMFEQLMIGEPERFLLDSLSALYRISAASLGKPQAGDGTARADKARIDEQGDQTNSLRRH